MFPLFKACSAGMIYLSVFSTTEERRQGSNANPSHSVEILILEFRVGRHRSLVVQLAATWWRELGVEPDLDSHLPWVTLNAGTLGKLFNVS